MATSLPKATAGLLAMLAFASGCDRATDADGAGFSDGFASGYAQACVLRTEAAPRRWSSAAYARGYADGVETGRAACRGEVARQADAALPPPAAYAHVERP